MSHQALAGMSSRENSTARSVSGERGRAAGRVSGDTTAVAPMWAASGATAFSVDVGSRTDGVAPCEEGSAAAFYISASSSFQLSTSRTRSVSRSRSSTNVVRLFGDPGRHDARPVAAVDPACDAYTPSRLLLSNSAVSHGRWTTYPGNGSRCVWIVSRISEGNGKKLSSTSYSSG